jgi:broad specificity phosphatase PhoE
MKLYLVRHGRSAGNLPGRMTGWSDHSLTPLGAAQAERVAERLATLGPMPIYTSDLPRALETAARIAARWPCEAGAEAGVGVHPDPRLREIDLGDYEGRSWDDFTADHELAAAFAREPLATTLPGGESLALVRERVIAAFDEIVAGDPPVACLVSHDGPIRTILNHVLRVPQERHWAISTSHGGLSLLETGERWVSVRFVNDTSHLRGLDAADEAAAGDAAAGEAGPGLSDDGEAPARAIEGL